MKNNVQQQTPWGFAQLITGHGNGMYSVSTASHGGIFLSDDRLLCLPQVLRDAPTFTGKPNWFEEDIDAILPVLAFPAEFSGSACWNAVRMARDYDRGSNGKPYALCVACRVFLTMPESLPVRDKAQLFEETNRIREKWESGGLSSDNRGWWVHFTKTVAPGKVDHREELLRDYPMQQFWTEEEITAAMVDSKLTFDGQAVSRSF